MGFTVDWPMVLEFLKLIFAWPLCTVSIVVFLSLFFREPITNWLTRLKIEYGGATLSSQQPTESDSTQRLPSSSTPKADPGDEFTKGLEKMDADQLKRQVIQWRANTYVWEYQYLNRFLVYNSRRVLGWLYDLNQPVNIEYADSFWRPQISARNERDPASAAKNP